MYSSRIEQSDRSQGAARKPATIRGTQPTTAPDFQKVADCGGPDCPGWFDLTGIESSFSLVHAKKSKKSPCRVAVWTMEFFGSKARQQQSYGAI